MCVCVIETYHIIYHMSQIILQSAGLPACLIGGCCSLFCCSWLVLVPWFSSLDFLLRLNQGHRRPSPPPYYYYYYYYDDNDEDDDDDDDDDHDYDHDYDDHYDGH